MPVIVKTNVFKPSCCNIDSIVGAKKAESLRTQSSIDVTEKEYDEIRKKNKKWFTIQGDKQEVKK